MDTGELCCDLGEGETSWRLGNMKGVLCLVPRCLTGSGVDEAHAKWILCLSACLDHGEGSSGRGKTEGDTTQSYV